MANRNTNPALWDKEWFMKLSLKHKLLIKYIWEKCDNSGVWSFNSIITSTHLGQKTTAADIESLPSDRLEKLKPGKYFFPDFLSEQIKGPLMHISRGERKPNNYHISIFELLVKNGLASRLDENGYIKNSGAGEGLNSPSPGAVESNSKEESCKESKEGGKGETKSALHPLQLYASQFPELDKMRERLSSEECLKLIAKHSEPQVKEVLEAMGNTKNIANKYVSVYRTADNWIKIRNQRKDKKAGPGAILEHKKEF